MDYYYLKKIEIYYLINIIIELNIIINLIYYNNKMYSFEEYIEKKIRDEFNNKESLFIALLPNLRFKEDNKKIYFYAKNPIKLNINNKIIFKNEFELNDISLKSKITVQNINFNCEIIEKELNNGLKIKIKYKSNHTLGIIEMQKISRSIESTILNLDIVDDNEDYDNYESYYDDLKYKFQNSLEYDEDNDEEENISNENKNEEEIHNINDDIEDPLDKFNKKNNLI